MQGMTYFHLMSDDDPPKALETYSPYVTPDEAVRWATKEAARQRRRIHIFRVRDDIVESQPWKTVEPPEEP